MEPGSTHWKKGVRYAALTDIGLRRSNNQDAHAVKIATTARQWLNRGHLFIVADGMGAHAAGEVASQLAVETVAQSYLKRSGETPVNSLVHAVYDAHRVIREKSKREDAYRDMGTTCDAFVMGPQGLLIAHVGDSRVYRVRGELIEQLTFDHSLVWEVCMATNLPFDQAPSYIPKNQITRSLGPTEKLVVDVEGPFPIAIDDIYLACSDGLSGQVSDQEIGELLQVFPPEVAGETLINLANLRGGPDNITMVIAQAVANPQSAKEVDDELRMPPTSWIALAAAVLSGLGALMSFLTDHIIPGGMMAIFAAFAVFLFFLLAKKAIFESAPLLSSLQPLGKGPYTKTVCTPSETFADNLGRILKELRQATRGHQLPVKSEEADACEHRAIVAEKARNAVETIRNYALAINYLMRELKKLSAKKK